MSNFLLSFDRVQSFFLSATIWLVIDFVITRNQCNGEEGLFQLRDFFVQRMFSACSAMFRQVQFLGSFGLVSLGDVVEITTNGAFQA